MESGMDPETLSALIARTRGGLGENDAAFLARVYGRPVDDYARRLSGWGFAGLGRVLDAGCGFGQWSAALARTNSEVRSIDVGEARVAFVQELAAELGLAQLEAQVARLDSLPFEAKHFDGVFCYGVLFLTRWREALADLARVLRPGGRLYVNANGFGWYRHMWYAQPNRTADYEPREHVARVFDNTWRYAGGQSIQEGYGVLIEPEELRAELEKLGFQDIALGAEAELSARGLGEPVAPFFAGEFDGDRGVYEMLATRR